MPGSRDHPVHLYKAWFFWTELLSHGQLRGWSDYWFFGYPAGDLYPIGAEAWVAMVRALTLGLLSWEATYGLALVAAYAFVGGGVYAAVRALAGAPAAAVACALWMLDPGWNWQGGWTYFAHWGVWSQSLALGFFLFGVAALQGGRSTRAGIWMGLGLMVHPANLIVMGFALPLLAIARAATGSPMMTRSLADAGALGGLLAAWWLAPMIARSGWTTDIGNVWAPLGELLRRLATGELFKATPPAAAWLAVLGAALGVRRRHTGAVFLALFAAAWLIFAGEETGAFLQERVSETFSRIQYKRMSVPLKLGLFGLAGYAAGEAWALGRARGWGPSGGLVGVALVGLFGWAWWGARSELSLQPRRAERGEIYTALLEWTAREQATSPRFSIAWDATVHDHWLMDAPIYNQTPIYKVGYTPAKLYRHSPSVVGQGLYEAAGVKYVVSREPQHRPWLTFERRFGTLKVYRFTRYRSRRWTLEGPGEVEEIAFERERVEMRLTGTTPESRLILHRGAFPRWRARVNGEEVPITTGKTWPNPRELLMTIPVSDGEVVFDYIWRREEWIGFVLTLAGLGAAGWSLRRAGRPA